MCRTWNQRLWAVFVMVSFLLCSSHALAGIIVTEGKISRCALTLKSAQALWSLGQWPDEREGCAPPADPVDGDGDSSQDTGHDFDDEDEELDLDDEELGDLDSTPDGYKCTDLGNGLELCEEVDKDEDEEAEEEAEEGGQGAGAGSAQGGAWLGALDSEGPHALSAQESVGGCQGGAPADGGVLLSMAVLLALVWTRRRRSVAISGSERAAL